MSVIIVKKEKDKIIIGADSQESSNQNSQENFLDSKLKQIEPNVYIASAGDSHIGCLLYAYVERNSILNLDSSYDIITYFTQFNKWLKEDIFDQSDENSNRLQRCEFILIIKNRIWQFMDFYLREIQEGEFNAIGSGSQSCMACIHSGADIETALKAVCRVDIFCSEPLSIKTIEIKQWNK